MSDKGSTAFDAVRWRSIVQWGGGAALCGALIASFVTVALTVSLVRQLRDTELGVGQSRDIQRKIQRIGKDLGRLGTGLRTFVLSRNTEDGDLYRRARAEVEQFLDTFESFFPDTPEQRRRLSALQSLSRQFLVDADKVLSASTTSGFGTVESLVSVGDTTALTSQLLDMGKQEHSWLTRLVARAESSRSRSIRALTISGAVTGSLFGFAALMFYGASRSRQREINEHQRRLAEMDVLMREADHRIRNSLTLLNSLLISQQHKGANLPELHDALRQAAGRVLTVARVHERLHSCSPGEKIEVGSYLQDLCSDLAQSFLPAEAENVIQVSVCHYDLPAERAISVGLIVFELVSNAVKYGAPSGDHPIQVTLTDEMDGLHLEIADGGPGLTEEGSGGAHKGLGMQVIELLRQQLGGTFEVDRSWPGARFVLTFPPTSPDHA